MQTISILNIDEDAVTLLKIKIKQELKHLSTVNGILIYFLLFAIYIYY